MTATEKDRDIVARTIWGEARGEGTAGQVAVAWTIRNRVFDGETNSWWGEGQRLAISEQTHFRKMSDAQRDQDRLRDRLATSDLRLSVFLDATDVAEGSDLSASFSTGG